MFCKNCKQDNGDVDYCSACGYDFSSNMDTSTKPEEQFSGPEGGEPLRWEETLRPKPVRTGLVYDDQHNLYLAKEAVEGFTGKYDRLRECARPWLPVEHPVEAEKPYRLFKWDSAWLKLGEWLKEKPPLCQRVGVWSQIASFVWCCHEQGLLVNQFHPHCIWVDGGKLQPVFEALEFISDPRDKTVIIYNEGFSSPEVREGNWNEVSFPADIYCLGKLLCFILDPESSMARTPGMEPHGDSFTGLNLLSRQLGFAIGKCLSNQPSKRWNRVADLIRYLRESELAPVNITGFSHIGFRELNEDAIYYSHRRICAPGHAWDTTIAILADGMGGLDQGEIASGTVVQMISGELKREMGELLGHREMESLDSASEVIFGMIREAITRCNAALVKLAANHGTQMGSTVVVAILINHYLYMGYVGDSRCYVFDEANRITFVSEDHSLVGKREAIGDISEAEALTSPDKNILYQAVGLKEAIRVDTYGTQLKPGQKIMLCSDVISGVFLKSELTEIFSAHPVINLLGNALFFEALERNSLDNCSLILAEIVKGSNQHEYQFELITAAGECGPGDGTIHELLPAGAYESGTAGPEPG